MSNKSTIQNQNNKIQAQLQHIYDLKAKGAQIRCRAHLSEKKKTKKIEK